MRVLLTGGAGFVARHLEAELLSAGHEVWLSDCLSVGLPNYIKADLTEKDSVRDLVFSLRPDAIVHLGAVSHVMEAAGDVDRLERVNILGTRYLLEAFHALGLPSRDGVLPRFLFVSTAQVMHAELSPYALSKLEGEAIAGTFSAQGLAAAVVRPANHTGPGQSDRFVLPSFVKQAIQIKTGRRRRFSVGNLDSVRDITDVRDVVRAYRLILEKGRHNSVYVVASAMRFTVRELLAKVAGAIGVPDDHEVDAQLWRPPDEPPVFDMSCIRDLGWSARIPIDKTIEDIKNRMLHM